MAQWGRQQLKLLEKKSLELHPISDDASFRRYFRFAGGAEGLVFVDAPPEHEDNPSFIRVSAGLLDAGLLCPKVLAADLEDGFMMITDLGDELYLPALKQDADRSRQLYDAALQALVKLRLVAVQVPPYNRERLTEEMLLFDDWFLGKQLGIKLAPAQQTLLAETRDLLVANALAQPSVFVHRDYHSRNLMLVNDAGSGLGPGILDFQDAVQGPLTYDLVSLLKDCYHRLPREEVVQRVEHYRQQTATEIDAAAFLKWFDLMGAQRHLKCAGIFCRLHLRDGKPDYLGDIPLVVDYLLEAASLYPELEALGSFLKESVQGRLPDLVQPK